MALPWVKLHVSLIDNDDFKRLSRAAKLTFFFAISLAGKCDMDGELRVRTGSMSVAEIAHYSGLTEKQQREALDELVAADFLYMSLDSAYGVQRWKEKAGDTSTVRTKRFRERHKNVAETFPERKSDAIDKDKDLDIDMAASLRSAAVGFGPIPSDPHKLRELAVPFLRRFGNCHDTEKQAKPLGDYAGVLAAMRGKGLDVPQAWQACEDALIANGGAPLFGPKIKTALNFTGARITAKGADPYSGLRVVGGKHD